MTQGLHKIIDKLILTQFPWISDYHIRVADENGRDFVLVIYYPNTDEDGSFEITDEFKQVEDLTRSVFKMMGFDRNTIFEGVRFETK